MGLSNNITCDKRTCSWDTQGGHGWKLAVFWALVPFLLRHESQHSDLCDNNWHQQPWKSIVLAFSRQNNYICLVSVSTHMHEAIFNQPKLENFFIDALENKSCFMPSCNWHARGHLLASCAFSTKPGALFPDKKKNRLHFRVENFLLTLH